MFTQPPTDDALPFARCEACDTEVLTWRDLAPDGQLILRCLDCDAPLDGGTRRGSWSASEASARGYVVEGYRDPEAATGCSGGACSTGACGSHD